MKLTLLSAFVTTALYFMLFGKAAHSSASTVVRTDSIPVYNSLVGWQTRINHLSYVANRLRQSDLPSRDVSFMTDSLIAPLVQDIYVQVMRQQSDTLKNKPKK